MSELPVGHAVDGQMMYGGPWTRVLGDVAVLLAWLALAVVATSGAARVQRIKPELAL